MATVDIRCPNNPSRLFMRMKTSGEPIHVTDENLLEISCSDCKREYRKLGESVFRVLHYYNLLGELIETKVVRDSAESSSEA